MDLSEWWCLKQLVSRTSRPLWAIKSVLAITVIWATHITANTRSSCSFTNHVHISFLRLIESLIFSMIWYFHLCVFFTTFLNCCGILLLPLIMIYLKLVLREHFLLFQGSSYFPHCCYFHSPLIVWICAFWYLNVQMNRTLVVAFWLSHYQLVFFFQIFCEYPFRNWSRLILQCYINNESNSFIERLWIFFGTINIYSECFLCR